MPDYYRKKPVIIEAVRLVNECYDDVLAFVTRSPEVVLYHEGWGQSPALDHADVTTLEGVMRAQYGDWLIRGVQGEVYPCKHTIFRQTYEHVPDYIPTDYTPNE